MPERAFHELGNDLTQALIAGDFPLYAGIMAMPLRIVPKGGQDYVLTTPQALRRDFDLYVTALKAAGVTDIYREVLDVRPEGGGCHRVFCRVHVMARAHRIAEPHGSEMLLVPVITGFRISEIVATPDHIDFTLGRRAAGPGSGLI